MLVIGSFLLSLIPLSLIIFVFFRRSSLREFEEIHTSFDPQLKIQWDNAIQGLVNAEIENGIGNLDQSDYEWIRGQYINEAASALRSMRLTKIQEDILLKDLNQKIVSANPKLGTIDGIVGLRNSA